MKSSRLAACASALIVTACAASSTPGARPTVSPAASAPPPTAAGPTITYEPATATLTPSAAAPIPTLTRTPIPTPTLAVTTVRSEPRLPGYVDVLAFGTSLSGETLTAAFRLRDLPETLVFDRAGTSPNELEYMWCALIFLDGRGSVKGSKPSDFQLCAMHFVPETPGQPNADGFDSLALQVDVWQHSSLGYSTIGEASLTVDTGANTLRLSGRIPGITSKALVLFDARDILLGESYSR